MSAKVCLLLASLVCAGAVIAGAFGAHGLKPNLSAAAFSTFQTAVTYQMSHGLGLLAVALLMLTRPAPSLVWVAATMFIGIVLFSGSLYGLALGAPQWLGPVTPLGGLFFIASWLQLASYAWRLPAPAVN